MEYIKCADRVPQDSYQAAQEEDFMEEMVELNCEQQESLQTEKRGAGTCWTEAWSQHGGAESLRAQLGRAGRWEHGR